MTNSNALVITSIASEKSPVLQSLAKQALQNNFSFILIGDVASPPIFSIDGCDFYSLERQLDLNFRYTKICPTKSYARKNIGYLLASQKGNNTILETDDDNIPYDTFWNLNIPKLNTISISKKGWVNVYSSFTNDLIWPRGLPLSEIHSIPDDNEIQPNQANDSPIQQGLVNADPDVDSVFRMIFQRNINFSPDIYVSLSPGSWSPFNSQNTKWCQEAYPLMYLPATCAMRLTDIWRSFIAQRIAWTCGWEIQFHSPTAYQLRNPHNLHEDFKNEVTGFIENDNIRQALTSLKLRDGKEHMIENILTCYNSMIANDWLEPIELQLLESWLDDMDSCVK